jgi:hypothetical protein
LDDPAGVSVPVLWKEEIIMDNLPIPWVGRKYISDATGDVIKVTQLVTIDGIQYVVCQDNTGSTTGLTFEQFYGQYKYVGGE